MATESRTEDPTAGRPSEVEWWRDPRRPLAFGSVFLVCGILMICTGSALVGGGVAALGAEQVVSWARRAHAPGNRVRRVLQGLEVALLVACLGLFVWHAGMDWGWF